MVEIPWKIMDFLREMRDKCIHSPPSNVKKGTFNVGVNPRTETYIYQYIDYNSEIGFFELRNETRVCDVYNDLHAYHPEQGHTETVFTPRSTMSHIYYVDVKKFLPFLKKLKKRGRIKLPSKKLITVYEKYCFYTPMDTKSSCSRTLQKGYLEGIVTKDELTENLRFSPLNPVVNVDFSKDFGETFIEVFESD